MTTQLAHINGRFFQLDRSFLLYAMKRMGEIAVLTSSEIIVSRSKKPANNEKTFMIAVNFGKRWDIPYKRDFSCYWSEHRLAVVWACY